MVKIAIKYSSLQKKVFVIPYFEFTFPKIAIKEIMIGPTDDEQSAELKDLQVSVKLLCILMILKYHFQSHLLEIFNKPFKIPQSYAFQSIF